jgi:hypothetical protein
VVIDCRVESGIRFVGCYLEKGKKGGDYLIRQEVDLGG